MARIYFEKVDQFISYMERFSGTERTILLDVKEDNSLVLRPVVTSRIDTAVISNISENDKARIKGQFTGKKFDVLAFRDEEDHTGKR